MSNWTKEMDESFNTLFAEAFATKFGQQVMDHMKQAKTHACPICTDEVIAHDDDFCDECEDKGVWTGHIFTDESGKAWRLPKRDYYSKDWRDEMTQDHGLEE